MSRMTAGRQRMWDVLRDKGSATASQLSLESGVKVNTVYQFMRHLKIAGYVDAIDGKYKLIRNTGNLYPEFKTSTMKVRDRNIYAEMIGVDLRGLWKKSGMSMTDFCVALGQHRCNGSKMKKIMSSGNKIPERVSESAKKLATEKGIKI